MQQWSMFSVRDRQARLRSLVDLATRFVQVDEEIEMRSAELIQQGFMVFDALHLTCAESGGADVFLTTDDRLRRRAARLVDVLQVRLVILSIVRTWKKSSADKTKDKADKTE